MSDTETAIEEGQVWDAHLSVKDRVGIRIVSRPTSVGPWYVVGMIPGGTVTQISEEEIRRTTRSPHPAPTTTPPLTGTDFKDRWQRRTAATTDGLLESSPKKRRRTRRHAVVRG